MLEVAEKFKSIGLINRTSGASSSIFGTSNLAQSITSQTKYRIGFYPIIDAEKPEIAMGIASCLCYLLEQYSDVKVYRVFAKIVTQDNDDEFDINDSQFTLEDWSFEGLDDNIVISGKVIREANSNTLELIVDRSMVNETEEFVIRQQFTALPDLLIKLPEIVKDVVRSLKEDFDDSELIISYSDIGTPSDDLDNLIEETFYWNLDLYLHLWGVEWEDDDILSQFNDMIETSKKLNNQFATWCVAMMAKQVMQIGLDTVGDVIVPHVESIFDQDTGGFITIASVGRGLVNLGYVEQALELVEQYSSRDSLDILVWATLIDIYVKANQFAKAIDANQQAIENGIEDERLYWRYIQLVMFAESNELFIEELLLIDPDEFEDSEHLIQELIASLEAIIALNPQSIRAVYALIPHLLDTDDIEGLWEYFQLLVDLDDDVMRYTHEILAQLYDVVNLEPGFDILLEAVNKREENPYLQLAVAQLAVIDENTELAQKYLSTAEAYVSTYGEDLEIEIQTIQLTLSFPDFEQRLSEINIVLKANGNAADSDVDFLEEAIEVAPKLSPLYATLARCYIGWEDRDTALEVVDEGINKVGKHPQLLLIKSQILWLRNEKDTAFQHLNEGIQLYPNDVSLLTQIARYLIDNEQLEDAKPYIERADIIAPSHGALWELKKIIAEKMAR